MKLSDPLLKRIAALAALCILTAIVLRLSASGSAWQRPTRPISANRDGTAATRIDFAALLPKSTLAYAEVPHVPTFLTLARRTGLAKALAQSQTDAFVASLLANLRGDAAAARGILKTLDTSLVPLLKGGAAIAILDVSQRFDELDAAFMADVSGESKKARGFLGMLSMMGLAVGQVSNATAHGHTATALQIGGREVAAWIVFDDTLVVATGTSVLADILKRIESGPHGESKTGPSLRASAAFTGTLNRTLKDHSRKRVDYFAYADVDEIIRGIFGDNAPDTAAAYGIADIDALALSGTMGEQVNETVFVSCPRNRPPLVASISARPEPISSPDYLPSDTLIAFTGKADMAMLVRQLSSALALESGEPSRGRGLQKVAQRIVAGPLQTIAEKASGEIAVAYWSAARVNWSPMAGMATELQARTSVSELAKRVTASLAAIVGGQARRSQIGESSGRHQLVMDFVERPTMRLPMLNSPACGQLEGFLLTANDPRGILEMESRNGPRLSEADGYIALLADLPQARSCILYVDVPRIVDRAFEPYARLAIATLLPGTNIGRDMMPSGAAIASHLLPSGLSLLGHQDGLSISASTPAGLPLTAGAAALVGARLMDSL